MADGAPTVLEWLLAVGEGHFSNYAPPRHQRYDVELAVRYRVDGEATWHVGRTENISSARRDSLVRPEFNRGKQVRWGNTWPKVEGTGNRNWSGAKQHFEFY